jgi:UDP-N-acetylmuramoyl-L-alanyl-D-glutamate--2,6-diaminopimelate ligase
MKILSDILYKTGIAEVIGPTDISVSAVTANSLAVEDLSVFVALRGTQVDGHVFIPNAISKGAVAVVCEEFPVYVEEDVTYVRVNDSAFAYSLMASNFYDNPSEKLKLVGITGTNGKTTVATLLYRLFRLLGYKAGLFSTVSYFVNDEEFPATHTTPDAMMLNSLLKQMSEAGCEYCFMEVSSHAVVQHRVSGLHFTGGVFTNITHDHLDYHQSFDNYLKAKKTFFDNLPSSAFALTNSDDRNGGVMLQNTRAAKAAYSKRTIADFNCRIIENSLEGLQLELDSKEVWCRLTGDFNASNLTAIYAAALLLKQDKNEVLTALSVLPPVEGRFDLVKTASGITGVIDYAHTPDALKNVLETLTEINGGKGKIITVVGCGGNRDSAKRPVMAAIACEFSYKLVLTSDNPRKEDPEQIIREMQTGINPAYKQKVVSILNRREAIRAACMLAGSGDIVLIAGKGHEKYQDIMGVKYPFDDKAVFSEIMSND